MKLVMRLLALTPLAFLASAENVVDEENQNPDSFELFRMLKSDSYDNPKTRRPTPRPTGKYGIIDTHPPTPRPVCKIDVDITCVDINGKNCGTLDAPDSKCDTDLVVNKLELTYLGTACDKSANTQNGACEDFNGGPSGRSLVMCKDKDDATLFDGEVNVGGTFEINNLGSAAPSIFCEINDSDDGSKRQELEIFISGDADLYLKDIFGSLQIEGCDDQNCQEDAVYTYKIENVGSQTMTVNVLERDELTKREVNGEMIRIANSADLLALVDNKVLDPTETTMVNEDKTFDLCVEGSFKTRVIGKADPGTGVLCEDKDTYSIVVKVAGCRLDADISCKVIGDDSSNCSDLISPDECADGRSILVPVEYTYTFMNVGQNSMELKEIELSRGSSTRSLLGSVSNKTLDFGEIRFVEEQENINVCEEAEIKTELSASADPEIGPTCFDSDEYIIILDPPTRPPTDPPTRPPTDPPTRPPTDPPTRPPTDPPTRPPTDPPTRPPTDPPTRPPTDPPTSPPTIPPVTNPPTLEPTIPDIFKCNVDIEVDCTPRGESEDCGSVVVTRTRCEERPIALVFKYNGGKCGQSDNIQPRELFQCFDFQDGPPTEVGATSFIRVTDIKGGAIIYHEDFVNVGDEYTVADPPFQVDANMNVTIYSSSDTTFDNMLQTLVFHSSCSQNLFLKDRYGASQLVVFVNNLQGVQDCFFNATFTIRISNRVGGGNAILTSLVTTLQSGARFTRYDFDDEVNGVIVAPGATFDNSALSFDAIIDLTVVTNNEVNAFIEGNSPQGILCTDFDSSNFVTGLQTPPNVPTRSPTNSPTQTPLPTPDPDTTACSIQAGITCEVINGGGLLGCNNIIPPASTQCLTGGFPRELEFIYRGGGCTNNLLQCNGSADLDEVWITIISLAENILWNRITRRDDFISIIGLDESLNVTVSTVENGRVGDELQNFVMNTTCIDSSNLELADDFGALQLVEFVTVDSNDRASWNAAFARIRMTYDVELARGTSISADITSASSVGGEENREETTVYSSPFDTTGNPPSDTVGPRDRLIFGQDVFLIDLIPTRGVTYNYELSVSAESTQGNIACGSTDSLQFIV